MGSIIRRILLFGIWSLIIPKVSGQHAADWMSGKHGIGFRIPGGVNIETCLYDVSVLVNQIKENIPEITWVLLGLSSGAYGDQYTSPHSILTDLNRASTPRLLTVEQWLEVNNPGVQDFDLENYPERDLFSEIADAFHAEGFKVIAYMASQGPTFMKHGERRAYDYNNKSVYVDSVAECEVLTGGTITDGKCSPSARKWKKYVYDEYGADDDLTLQDAWAEKILGEYVKKFDGKEGRSLIDAWWFDQGIYMNVPLAHSLIMAANPNAIIAFNKGQKVPLLNNNPPFEHFTGGHPNPIIYLPPYDDANEAIIQSVEDTPDGYFESEGSYSLGHTFQMTNDNWNHGTIVWDGDRMPKAIDWMSRVLNAKGAWTWNVKRNFYPYYLHPDDIALVKAIIAGINDTATPTKLPSPTVSPTEIPTNHPTKSPTKSPTPTASPTKSPTDSPTTSPTDSPTKSPLPTVSPTKISTDSPTKSPPPTISPLPTTSPTVSPTNTPTANPTKPPTKTPSSSPTINPTEQPTTASPTKTPSSSPTASPSKTPTTNPTPTSTNTPTGAPTYSPTKLPTTSPTESPTPKPCSEYRFLKSCKAANCSWDKKSNTCSDPCSSYRSHKGCKAADCVWNKKLNICSENKLCSEYKEKQCENNDCYWDSIIKICSSAKPCQAYIKKKTCPEDVCVWKSNKCSTFIPCSTHKMQKKCQKKGCFWDVESKICSATTLCVLSPNAKRCRKNACYWNKDKRQCYDTKPCWVYTKQKTCQENDCSWRKKTKRCV